MSTYLIPAWLQLIFIDRKPRFSYYNKQMPFLFVMESQPSIVEDILDIFNQTVMSCGQKHHPGVFGLSARIIFFIGKQDKKGLKKISDTVFSLKYVRNSAYVAIAQEWGCQDNYETPTLIIFYNEGNLEILAEKVVSSP